MFVLVRNPGGKQTPQDTIHPTPDLKCLEEIVTLSQLAVINRSQAALRDLVCFV
jgi:hypothetical protein